MEIITPEIITPEIITPKIITPEIITPEIITPEIITPEIITPKIINENCTLEHLKSMNEEELYQYHLKIYRAERNLRLEETDKYINQIDRLNNEQIEELKLYRQNLRDFINGNHEAFKTRSDAGINTPNKSILSVF